MNGRAQRLDPRVLAALVLAMAGAAVLILWAGRGTGLIGDELYYYSRLVERAGEHLSYPFGVEYLLAPHNGHLQLTGKLVYEAIFAAVGTDYLVLRVVELIGVLLCVALVFELVRRRVGAIAALAAAALLLFLGAAWEVMIWPFDLHTAYACAAGLAALLVLERRGRGADPIVCALLVVSVATIEVGLAFVAAVAVLILWDSRRLRRAWVFIVPAALYLAWSLWATRFDQGDTLVSNLLSDPGALAESAAATLGAMVGRIDDGARLYPATIGVDGFGIALAVIGAAILVLRLARGPISPPLVALLAALVVYWSFIALAGRPPDSSRYLLVGAALVILIAAEALRGAQLRPLVAVGLFVVVAAALPANIATLLDGRAYQVAEGEAARAHFGIIELARDRGEAEAEVARTGGGLVKFGVAPGTYLEAAERIGSIGFSLERIRSGSEHVKVAADHSLALLSGIEFAAVAAIPDSRDCRRVGEPGRPVAFALPPTGGLLSAQAGTRVGLGRLTSGFPSVQLGKLPDRGWRRLKLRPDSLPGRWRFYSTAGLRFCPR